MKQHNLGTFQWMLQTEGKIKFKDKIKLMNKLLVPSLITPIKENIYKNKADKKLDMSLEHIVIPDTKMIEVAVEEIESKANLALINHSWRTYFWGAILGQLQQKNYDPETLLTASLFHDIGLTEAHITSKGCKCFTHESADQFQLKAQEINFDTHKITLIKDAICIHMNGFSDESQPSEVSLLQQGASCDVIGEQLHKIPQNLKLNILTKYPRENFNQTFIELLHTESKLNPNSRTAFLKSLGLPLLIHLNPFKS